ncbi:DUF3267 domain-containing protein [Halovenus halobia]|uniref:DUF3267 domain-containing protein n=1 Tax=Halovenus halobia TaxID=3396622 RepID=UPI003F55B89F
MTTESPSSEGEVWIPAPPPGYSSPRPLGQSMLVLLLGSLVLTTGALLGSIVLFAVLDTGTDAGIIQAPFWAMVLFGLVFTALCHEGIHGLVYRYFGYEVEYGFASGGLYTAAPGQIHTREESVWITAAPVVTLTLVGLLFLLAPSNSLGYVGVTVLVLNTSGSVADIEQLSRLLALPTGTLVCDADATYIYVPTDTH